MVLWFQPENQLGSRFCAQDIGDRRGVFAFRGSRLGDYSTAHNLGRCSA